MSALEAKPTAVLEPASVATPVAVDTERSVAGAAGLRPRPGFARPLILTTVRWFSDARLAHALIGAGFSVSACRPRAHVLEVVDGLACDRRLSRLRPERSVVRAIREARPDVVIPGDEGALALLRRLHRRAEEAEPELAALIARSLGVGCERASTTSRTALFETAVRAGVAAPETRVVPDDDALRAWTAARRLPIVLKTDGSWGGRGVAIVRDEADLHRTWRAISTPPGLTRAIKRALLDLDGRSLSMWLRRTRPIVNAQEFVDGREAIATVACLGGEVLAIVCLDVLRTSEAKGPAAVVRVIDHVGMAETARRLVRRLGLTGFCGFDFMLTREGDAQLLELNARGTPTCYLLVEGGRRRGDTITLFPAAPAARPEVGSEGFAPVDSPVGAPLLLHAGEQMVARSRRPAVRLAARLTKRFSPLP